MRLTIFALLLLPLLANAGSLSDIYWSNYACGGYIYHFNSTNNSYKIYTRLTVKDKKNGEYNSYQLTEGQMKHKEGNIYLLINKDINEAMTIDFGDMTEAVMKSKQFGRVLLIQCENKEAKQLIREAENHFKSCPKNVLNCKSL